VERRNKGGGACSPRQNIKPIIIGKEVSFLNNNLYVFSKCFDSLLREIMLMKFIIT
jgi:hypothetical protein